MVTYGLSTDASIERRCDLSRYTMACYHVRLIQLNGEPGLLHEVRCSVS